LQSNGSVNRPQYFRILALACIDILLTLPLGVINATAGILGEIRESLTGIPFRFFHGWAFVHSDWGPVAFTYAELFPGGPWAYFSVYVEFWASPVLAIAIFALFGLTSEACATYWRGFCTVAKHFGWTPPLAKHENLGEIQFGARQLTVTEQCVL
jgi:hypothetical protein